MTDPSRSIRELVIDGLSNEFGPALLLAQCYRWEIRLRKQLFCHVLMNSAAHPEAPTVWVCNPIRSRKEDAVTLVKSDSYETIKPCLVFRLVRAEHNVHRAMGRIVMDGAAMPLIDYLGGAKLGIEPFNDGFPDRHTLPIVPL